MKKPKMPGVVFLAACIALTIATFAPATTAFAAATVSVTAANEAAARKKGWKAIKKSHRFKRWSEGVRYTTKAWKGHVCVTTVFVGGNGKVWYIYLTTKKRSKNKWVVRWQTTPLKGDCKKRL